MMPHGRCGAWRVEWLREGERDGGAEQFEDASLDGGRGGELLDFLAAEGDGLAGGGGEGAEEGLGAGDRRAVGGAVGGVLGLGLLERRGGGDRVGEWLRSFRLLITFPIRIPILSGSFSRPAAAEAWILARSFSVSASSSSRVRARSAASTGLWQQTSRSPG